MRERVLDRGNMVGGYIWQVVTKYSERWVAGHHVHEKGCGRGKHKHDRSRSQVFMRKLHGIYHRGCSRQGLFAWLLQNGGQDRDCMCAQYGRLAPQSARWVPSSVCGLVGGAQWERTSHEMPPLRLSLLCHMAHACDFV